MCQQKVYPLQPLFPRTTLDKALSFAGSGWAGEGRLLPQGVVWTGLVVYRSSNPDAATVMQALTAAAIPFSVGSETCAQVTIMVGGKPPLF
jgi:hypothetical protein